MVKHKNRHNFEFSSFKKGLFTILLSSQFSKSENWSNYIQQVIDDYNRKINITNEDFSLPTEFDLKKKNFENTILFTNSFYFFFFKKNLIQLTIEEIDQIYELRILTNFKNDINTIKKHQQWVEFINQLNIEILNFILNLNILIGDINKTNGKIVFTENNFKELKLESFPQLKLLLEIENEIKNENENGIKNGIKNYFIMMVNKIYYFLYLLTFLSQTFTAEMSMFMKNTFLINSTFIANEIKMIDMINKKIILVNDLLFKTAPFSTKPGELSLGNLIYTMDIDPSGSGFPITFNSFYDLDISKELQKYLDTKNQKRIKYNIETTHTFAKKIFDSLSLFLEIGKKFDRKNKNNISDPLKYLNNHNEYLDLIDEKNSIFIKNLYLIYNNETLKTELLRLLSISQLSILLKQKKPEQEIINNNEQIASKKIIIYEIIQYDININKYRIVLRFYFDDITNCIVKEISYEQIKNLQDLGDFNNLCENLLKNKLNLHIIFLKDDKPTPQYSIQLNNISKNIIKFMYDSDNRLIVIAPYILTYINSLNNHALRLLILYYYLLYNNQDPQIKESVQNFIMNHLLEKYKFIQLPAFPLTSQNSISASLINISRGSVKKVLPTVLPTVLRSSFPRLSSPQLMPQQLVMGGYVKKINKSHLKKNKKSYLKKNKKSYLKKNKKSHLKKV